MTGRAGVVALVACCCATITTLHIPTPVDAAVVTDRSRLQEPAPADGATTAVPPTEVPPTEVPAAGEGLSPEVARVPASSDELDAATADLERLVERRSLDEQELADSTASLGSTSREQVAVGSLAERRASQASKATGAADRARAALGALTVERFISGDDLLVGLDPSLSYSDRLELEQRRVLTDEVSAQLLGDQRYTASRRDRLVAERDDLSGRFLELTRRSDELTRRIAELTASLSELAPRIVDAQQRVERARLTSSIDGTDLSAVALDAYWRASQTLAVADPSCGVTWWALAGIGRTESRHGTYRDAVLGPDGVVAPPIYGPALDGSNAFAVVGDSDGGALDGTSSTDRAVGPMQFLPSTWDVVGTDQTGDGRADPQNIHDAALSAGVYLCRSGPGLGDAARLRAAYLTYNRSTEYVEIVFAHAEEYAAAVALR